MSPLPFDPSKPVQTRDGRPARVLCTDAAGVYPIVALIRDQDGTDHADHYTAAGHFFEDSSGCNEDDLINIPPAPVRHTIARWVSVYRSPQSPAGLYTRMHEERGAVSMDWDDRDLLARLPITLDFVEGEGLTNG